MQDLEQIWNEIKGTLEILQPKFILLKTWYFPLKPSHIENNIIYFKTDNSIIYSHFEGDSSEYLFLLQNAVKNVLGENYSAVITFADKATECPKPEPPSEIKPAETRFRPDYTFENFVVGPSNQLAYSASVAVAENPGYTYNPLFFYGNSGLGKTHLMQAIAQYILSTDPKSNVLYVSSEEFTNDLISAIKFKRQDELRSKYRTVDVLLIDDIQFFERSDFTQDEMFNTFENLVNKNKAIIVSCDRPPQEMVKLDERLRTRFSMGLPVDIQPPDFETRTAIISKKAESMGLFLSEEICRFIGQSITSSIRDYIGAINKIMAYKDLTNNDKPITLDFVKEALKITEKAVVSTDTIKDAVARHYNIDVKELSDRKRTKIIAYARQVAMYLCRSILDETYVNIGKSFGGRDHTTVMHNIEAIEKAVKEDADFKNEINELANKINN